MRPNPFALCLAFIFLAACSNSTPPSLTPTVLVVTSPSIVSPTLIATTPSASATATATLEPTATATPLPSPTPTIKPHELAITTHNIQSIVQLKEFGRSYPTEMIWAPVGNVLIVASLGNVSLVNADTFEIIRTFEISQSINPFTGVGNLAVSSDGKHFFTVNNSVQAWDINNGQALGTWGYIDGGIRSFSISADGRILAIAGPAWPGGGDPDYKMEIIDMARNKRVYSVQQYGIISFVAVNRNGNLVASNSERGIEIFDGRTGALLQTINDRFGQLAFDSNDLLAISDNQSVRTVQLWDAKNGQLQSTIEGGVGSPTFSADGLWLALWRRNGTIQIRETANYQLGQTLKSEDEIESIAFSPEGKRLAAITSEGISIWNIESGQITHSFTGFTSFIQSVTFSPDSKFVLGEMLYQSPPLQAWDVESGAPQSTTIAYTHSPSNTAQSPNGQIRVQEWIDKSVYPPEGVIRLIATTTGQVIHELRGHQVVFGEGFTGMIESVVFNWDGSILASAGHDGSVWLWDVNTGQPLMTLPSHASVTDVNFSPDGRYLATSSWDGTIRLWGIPNP